MIALHIDEVVRSLFDRLHNVDMPRLVLPFLTLALLLGPAAGQQEPRFRSQINLVPVPTMVRNDMAIRSTG
ncbi:MAG: hypothetical protein DMG70_03720 [Acidobacteria bacterium]|nr:MAG: hypothetical protein DMG70_03720 [Acidobacteriota bacterium]